MARSQEYDLPKVRSGFALGFWEVTYVISGTYFCLGQSPATADTFRVIAGPARKTNHVT